MKKLILTAIVAIATSLVSYSQVYDPDIPVIEEFPINIYKINDIVGDHSGPKLYEELGYVFIPNTYYKHDGRSKGILITHTDPGEYLAFEVRCPVCYSKGKQGVFKMWTLISAKCNRCDAQAMSIINTGSCQLTAYNHGTAAPMYLIQYDMYQKTDSIYMIAPSPASIP